MLIPHRQVGPNASYNLYGTPRNNSALSVTQQHTSLSLGKSLRQENRVPYPGFRYTLLFPTLK
jgi:hypothetical protein